MIIVLTGTTASGKSTLACEIATKLGGAVINADSQQIYAETPILSAAPEPALLEQAPHLLYCHHPINEAYSVAKWLAEAVPTIKETMTSGKLPIVVGGTGMYIKLLMEGMAPIPEISQEDKSRLKQEWQNLTMLGAKEQLLAELPEMAGTPYLLDQHRLERAWMVWRQTNKSMLYWHQQPNITFFPESTFIPLLLEIDRTQVYENCNNRFEKMLANGALEEVDALIHKYPNHPTIGDSVIGVRELRKYQQGALSLEEAANISKQRTRNYAKRQFTWFRGQFGHFHKISTLNEALTQINT